VSLSQRVIEFAQRALDKPGVAVDPAELNALRRSAHSSIETFHTALNAPNAPYSWENRVLLLGATAVSNRVSFPFPQKMDITGMNPVLTDLGIIAPTFVPGNVLPSADDLDVQIDINNENTITSLRGVTTPIAGAPPDGTFITLSSTGILVPRILALVLEAPSPDVGMTFRWKRGPGIFRDTMIAVTLFVRRPDNQISANVASAARGL
jgi:hypothetical protein